MRTVFGVIALCLVSLIAPGALALDDGDGTGNNCDHYNPLNNPYFGDTHVHTTLSVDAFASGAETTPEQAYEFAMGLPIDIQPYGNSPAYLSQLERPLDFALLSDHAEYFGEYTICQDPAHPAYSNGMCVLLRARNFYTNVVWSGNLVAPQDELTRFSFCGPDGSICTNEIPTLWQQTQDAADQFYDRSTDCNFTTFIGYEYTGSTSRTNEDEDVELNMFHRNVVFRNSIVPTLPTSYFEAPYPEQLYDALDADCVDATNPNGDCEVLVIPHNSNMSQGKIFELINPDGTPYDQADANRRARFERLIEVVQHKGASECLPGGIDELCDFEIVPGSILVGAPVVEEGTIRDGLKQGLLTRYDLGANPFKLGMVGSTDTHRGTPGNVQERVLYPGHGGVLVPEGVGLRDLPFYNPGGLAVVWAAQNSRAALFDAMMRREVYATSGPRHIVRFFGGYNLPTDICSQPDLVQTAYDNGVPMGSELPEENPSSASPGFLVWAQKDPGTPGSPGNDLQRIQIIKGWTDATGTAYEQVYEVAGDPDNGAGVDINTCANIGSGFTELCQHWEDPDFDPAENAFYYARVIENPSCRWSQRQCIDRTAPVDCADPNLPNEQVGCCLAEVPKTVQERSWTSPIWYRGDVDTDPPGC